jgi:2,4-dienoyl-CoA reductase-like NADH-dependent reductase (Old Yellow Enzyme family)
MKAALLLVVGLVGLVQAVAPRPVVRAWTRVAYRDAGDAEPREWTYVAARAEGAALVLVSVVGLFRVATADSDDEEPPVAVEN